MKYIKFVLIGVFFGIVMTKSEAISWFRIQEMFRFQSFHMYGIIGTAVATGMVLIFLIKKYHAKNINGDEIVLHDKEKVWKRYFFGGSVFGLGWALTGACPGPMYTLVGNGYYYYILVILAAILGTFVYGLLRHKLPH